MSRRTAPWLDEKLLSPYDYWQFWRNSQDADVGRFPRLFTDLPLDEIVARKPVGRRDQPAKIVLATEATAMLHGRDVAEKSAETARRPRGRRRRCQSATLGTGATISVLEALTGLGFVLPMVKETKISRARSGLTIKSSTIPLDHPRQTIR
jgi:tyrosyl-tRNA synthetase